MSKSLLLLSAALILAACAPTNIADEPLRTHSQMRPGNTDPTYGLRQMAITDPLRPAEEVARDPLRRPDEMLAFIGLSSGDVIADIRPEEGYFTRLFARVVGPSGHVYAVVPTRTAEREDALADTLADAYPNVSRVTTRLETMTFDRPLDLANPDDDRTINVFDEAIRGRTDQFVYRFRKPG